MNNNSQQVIKVFKNGGIVIFPTDTAFGIGCRIDNAISVKKIFKIRQRSEEKPLLALVNSIEMAEKYAELNNSVRAFVRSYWPGGVTLILPCKKDMVPEIVRANGSTLAVRMPKHEELLQIIGEVGVPIVAPSANRSGENTPYKLEDVNPGLLEQVDFVFLGSCTYENESTIIDTTIDPWKIIREGAVAIEL